MTPHRNNKPIKKKLYVEIQHWKTGEIAFLVTLKVGRLAVFDMPIVTFNNWTLAKASGLLAKLYTVAAELGSEIGVKGRRYLDGYKYRGESIPCVRSVGKRFGPELK